MRAMGVPILRLIPPISTANGSYNFGLSWDGTPRAYGSNGQKF